MAHDLVASFYGGYDQVGVAPGRQWRIPRMTILIAIGAILLIAFIAADVSAYENLNVDVTVTSVAWVVDGEALSTTPGFSMHGGQSTTLTGLCDSFCLRWVGATVSAPFTLVAFTVAYHSEQITNVTIRAPSSSYDGPLTITLFLSTSAFVGTAG